MEMIFVATDTAPPLALQTVLMVAIGLFIIVLLYHLSGGVFQSTRNRRTIARRGITSQAVIIEMEATSQSIEGDRLYRLRYRLDDSDAEELELDELAAPPPELAERLAPGVAVEIKYLPGRPNRGALLVGLAESSTDDDGNGANSA